MKAVFSALRDFLAGLLGTDGATATALATLGAPLSGYVAKTTTYSAVAADKGKLIDCTGTWSLGLLAAATAGDAFCIGARNSGTGTITIDANLSETINGATTLALLTPQQKHRKHGDEPRAAGGDTIGVPSTEVPALMRVAPGDPEGSYLLKKVEGSAGIVGNRMGTGDPAEGALVRRWIASGAR